MKKLIFSFSILILLFAGCSKKEDVKLSTSGSNAFGLDMGGSWEVQALTELRGFDTQKKDGQFYSRVFFTIDVITPDNQVLSSLFTKEDDKKDSEEFKSMKLEAQFNVDSNYPVGKYKAVFNIKDMISNKAMKDTVSFTLEK